MILISGGIAVGVKREDGAMQTKAALYREAQNLIDDRRHAAQALAFENRQRLCEAAPMWETLRLQLLNTQIEQARQAALGQSQASAQTAVQDITAQMDALASAAGFESADLQPRYSCSACGDTGYSDGLRCSCVQQQMRRLRRAQINGEFPLEVSDFDHFRLDKYSAEVDAALGTSPRAVMTQVLEYCQAYAEHFSTGCPSLLLMGDAGLGKTHLALAIAGKVLDRGYDVVYVSAQQAFAAIDAGHEAGEPWLDAMLEADLLILDDLGTEYVVPHTISVLYQIVNTRLCAKRPTIYTTNIVTQQLMNVRYTEKVASRLLGGCEILQFFGEDIRLQGK